MNFKIAFEQREESALIQLSGDLDMVSAPALCELVTATLEHGPHTLVIDLDRLDFIDSRGIYALLKSLRAVQACDGSLRIVVNDERLKRILSITGLDKVLSLYPDRFAAVAAADSTHSKAAKHSIEEYTATDAVDALRDE